MKYFFFFTSLVLMFFMSVTSYGQSFQDFYNGLPEISIPYNFSNDQHTVNPGQTLPANLQNQHDDYRSFTTVGRIDMESGYYFLILKKQSSDDGADVYILVSIDENENINSSLVIGVENSGQKGADFKIESDKTLRVAYYDDSLVTIMDYSYDSGLLNSNPVRETVSMEEIVNM